MRQLFNRSHRSSTVMEPLEPRTYFSVDLTDSVSFVAPASGKVKPGQSVTIAVTVANDGTTVASGPLSIVVGPSANSDGSSPIDTVTTTKKIHLKPGANKVFRLSVRVPVGFVPGNYFAVAEVDPNNTFGETNTTNNLAVSTDAVTVLDPYPNVLNSTWSGTIKVTKGVDKGLIVTAVRTFTSENDTSGAVTISGTNYFSNDTTVIVDTSGTISTSGVTIGSGFDVPEDSTGIYYFKGTIVGDTWRGTYVNAINSGVFVYHLST
jgi:hypothetical protein